ncbi:MAG: hypothetical protein RR891_02655 [Clostridium sp.]
MDCPAKSKEVQRELCELLYPYGCGSRCQNIYRRWINEEEEVRKLEGLGCREE